MLTECIASIYLAIRESLHAGSEKKVLHCTQNELQILSALNPASNYPRMA